MFYVSGLRSRETEPSCVKTGSVETGWLGLSGFPVEKHWRLDLPGVGGDRR